MSLESSRQLGRSEPSTLQRLLSLGLVGLVFGSKTVFEMGHQVAPLASQFEGRQSLFHGGVPGNEPVFLRQSSWLAIEDP